jgi:t-SNARE complex subunit (syntaxin)
MDQFVEGYGIPAEKMQAFQLENDALVREYMDMPEQVSTTQASLNDIARLQSTLQEQLVYQAAQIDCLYDDAITTVDTVRKANTHLNQAASRQSTSVKMFIWFIFLASLFVLLLHIISD